MWGATIAAALLWTVISIFQSTLPVWGATSIVRARSCPLSISIHAPRVGGDFMGTCLRTLRTQNFNPRSPCGERPAKALQRRHRCIFQSTLPVWGATSCGDTGCVSIPHFNPRSPCGERLNPTCDAFELFHFNPRSPCGERPLANVVYGKAPDISIHAPRVGSDAMTAERAEKLRISIHAPRVGSDSAKTGRMSLIMYFNPRSPCGERHS